MNKFLKDLEKELKRLKVNPKEINEILEDHKEMMETAKQEGLNDEEISLKFGDPLKIASDIHQDSIKSNSESNFMLDDVESLAKFDTNDYTFVKGFNLVPEGLEFNISFVVEDLILSDYDGEGIQIYQKSVKNIEDYEISLKDKQFTLRLLPRKKFLNVFNYNDKEISFLVLIPRELKLKSFNYKTVSGDVVVNKLLVDKFKLKSTNGDINLSNVDLGEAAFSLVNGDVEILGMKALSTDISLVNGDTEIEKAIIKGSMHFNSVSGGVELVDVECDTVYFKTVSGDIDGRNFYVRELVQKSVSGDVNIENDDKSRKIIVKSKKSLSGDVKIN